MKFLVDFKAEATTLDINTYFQQHGCSVIKEWDNFENVYFVEAATAPPTTDIVERVAEENHLAIKPLEVINLNPYYGTHADPAHADIVINVGDAKDWWKNYCRGEPEFDDATTTIKRLGHNISVYIMDSGIDASHPEFVNADITNIYTVTPGDFSDNRGHGTAIASVIAGETCGVTAAKLKIVKIFDPGHGTTEREFLDALDAIITDHEDNTFSVLNASWSIAKNAWVEHKLRILEDEGVFIVAAAGNNGSSIEDVTPASMLDAITVGAYNQNLTPCDFSNYTGGSMVSVAGGATNHGELDGWAPGEQIWAAGLNNTYGYVAGTSFAAAITSAVLASNLTYKVNSDSGQIISGYETTKFSAAVVRSNSIVFKRINLLDLSEPKYADSVNFIATFSDRNNLTIHQVPDELATAYRVNQGLQGARIFQPTLTKSIEILTPLPENFSLIPDGRIYGKPSSNQGPQNGEPYVTYLSTFRRTNLDDTQETISVTIYVLPENFSPDTLPSDDPVVITLSGTCAGFSVPGCNFNGGGCIDYCNVDQSCCAGPEKSSIECDCQG
jgi:hypothetical protein